MDLTVNGKSLRIDADPEMPLLWALRDLGGVLGPKFGCGIAACGACTVIVDGAPVRSCSLPVGQVQGEILTIEGLSPDGVSHPLQKAWIDQQVPQCGYCQSGMIMAAAGLLRQKPKPARAREAVARVMAEGVRDPAVIAERLKKSRKMVVYHMLMLRRAGVLPRT